MKTQPCPCCAAHILLLTQSPRRCAFCGAKLRAVGGRLELDQAPIVTSAEDARMRAAIVEVCRG